MVCGWQARRRVLPGSFVQPRETDMKRYLCHEQPDLLDFAAEVVETRPGAVILSRTAFYPGGGGQLPDRGILRWAEGELAVEGLEPEGDKLWHILSAPKEVHGVVEARIDRDFRRVMCQLHTDLHILNALVFGTFDGALVNGVQMAADGTARIDFDLPDADNDRLRALEPAFNDAIRQDLPVRELYVPMSLAEAEPGLLRSRSVTPPPQKDGTVRVIEIAGLDRQACGGTHLASTGASPPIRLLKIENKGRHNRRVRIGLRRD
jgi:misacylated tRNA(Ala) deacylase